MSRVALLLALLVPLLGSGCHREPKPMTPKEGELPPLPPASGTAIGYLVDSAATLKLRDDQLAKLKDLDTSLAARNDQIDTQLRSMERPDVEPAEKGQPPPRHNNAPGAQVVSTPAAQKLHKAKADNDREALAKAFAVLDPDQQETAKRLLDERGISTPGATTPTPRTDEPLTPVEP